LQVCNQDFMLMCDNQEVCIHKDLYCDGIVHCPDESDEKQDICGNCPRSFGFPPKTLTSATVSCTHR
jgi:hypothetical protein